MSNCSEHKSGIIVTISDEKYQEIGEDRPFLYMLEKYAAVEVNLHRNREERHFLLPTNEYLKRIEQVEFRLMEILEFDDDEFYISVFSTTPDGSIEALAQEQNIDIVSILFAMDDYPEIEEVDVEPKSSHVEINVEVIEEDDDEDIEVLLQKLLEEGNKLFQVEPDSSHVEINVEVIEEDDDEDIEVLLQKLLEEGNKLFQVEPDSSHVEINVEDDDEDIEVLLRKLLEEGEKL